MMDLKDLLQLSLDAGGEVTEYDGHFCISLHITASVTTKRTIVFPKNNCTSNLIEFIKRILEL